MTDTKRILIVDDDQSVRISMHGGLQRMEPGWEVMTASNGEDALQQIESHNFDLVITDLRMPGMQGLELIRHIQGISPATKVILLTAYGSDSIEREAEELDIHSYLSKPVPLPAIRKIVRAALMRTARARQDRVLEPIEPEAEDEILQRVTLLLEQTGAFCTLLISSAGHLIAQAGITHGVDVNALAALVAANVAAMAEISRLLESKANFKSFFQEGEDFNIYSHIVNEEAILIVVARPDVKTGLIWLYARRAADELQETLQQIPMPSMEDLDIDALNAEFDNAFTFDEPQTKPAAPSKPKEIQPEPADDGDVDLLSLEDAIAKGLVPYELFGASEN